jgi:16S rRNA (cytosine967-C5)-methyltransferase
MEENDWQIGKFLERNPDARIAELDPACGLALRFGRQILPGMDGQDGFYYAALESRGDAAGIAAGGLRR